MNDEEIVDFFGDRFFSLDSILRDQYALESTIDWVEYKEKLDSGYYCCGNCRHYAKRHIVKPHRGLRTDGVCLVKVITVSSTGEYRCGFDSDTCRPEYFEAVDSE